MNSDLPSAKVMKQIDKNVKISQELRAKHRRCGIKYCERHDADYCAKHDVWIEQRCPYPKNKPCAYCSKRPDKPSEVK
jgi:hypothetical protein